MGKTIAEKIIASHCKRNDFVPGELISASVDCLISNEINSNITFHDFEKLENSRIFDKEKIVIVPDHYAPNKDVKAAEQCKYVREFCKNQKLPYYYEVGRMGIEHVLFHEEGFVGPGDFIVGIDSHSCTHGAMGAFSIGCSSTDMLSVMTLGELWIRVPETMKITFKGKLLPDVGGKDLILYVIKLLGLEGARYKVIEFYGDAISSLSMDNRFSLCNMAVECGAKSAIIPPDTVTLEYANSHCRRQFVPVYADRDAEYADEIEIDISELQPQVAAPDNPANVYSVEELCVSPYIRVDQVVVGSCTNGRLDDIRVCANMLRSNKVHADTRMIVIPGSQLVYKQCLREGLFDIIVNAGAAISTPTCGPCLGGHMGILAENEVCVSTTNRNFPGRMGHIDSKVYLSGPAVATASAIMGRIAAPREVNL